jgi:hypothetical protein
VVTFLPTDVSVGKEQGKLAGRRGLAGTVLVYKIAGALAAQGYVINFYFFQGILLHGKYDLPSLPAINLR